MFCDNGHLACASCCPKLNGKCPACALPIGHVRCRAMESVLISVFVPCPNAMFGCAKNVTYGTESIHEKECVFSRCSCPALDCDYTGSYKDLWGHYDTHQKKGLKNLGQRLATRLTCGDSFIARMNISDKILIKIQEGVFDETTVRSAVFQGAVWCVCNCKLHCTTFSGSRKVLVLYLLHCGRTHHVLQISRSKEDLQSEFSNPSGEFHVDPSKLLAW
ncbi:unnamed protein product [Thlaspi arvense]|uniref:SIAH-type domain-containing protein n=1 Tax=Thlaspi arvense TaxID=13288 RepID=A0AAU9RU14_THLAR|nr:unnamed protein product [Thlaspi arvense]